MTTVVKQKTSSARTSKPLLTGRVLQKPAQRSTVPVKDIRHAVKMVANKRKGK